MENATKDELHGNMESVIEEIIKDLRLLRKKGKLTVVEYIRTAFSEQKLKYLKKKINSAKKQSDQLFPQQLEQEIFRFLTDLEKELTIVITYKIYRDN